MMRNWYDVQSLAYLLAYIAAMAVQWVYGFSLILYSICLFSVIAVQVVHHNHVHLGIWHSKRLNRLTSLLISITTAVPSAMIYGGHLRNHHVHQHGPEDVTRTYRFGGDHNHFLGYLLHPFQAYSVLMPKFVRAFLQEWPRRTRFARDLLSQVLVIGMCWVLLCLLDWQKFLLLVAIPQAFGLHWLLGANYFQHAHCDDQSEVNYARNFTGAVNYFWMNIGFHTAHHDYPRAHWSTLRELHKQQCSNTDSRLCYESFVLYVVKTFFLAPFIPSFRSQTLKGDNG